MEDITCQLQVNYDHQISNLKKEAETMSGQHESRMNDLHALYQEKIRLAKEPGINKTLYWILIFAAVIIGILVGRLLS